MELVYLWVKNYKNIHQQGFNFSERYDCEYKNEKFEKKPLKDINDLNIFPQNISVKAIVGKNGSGKSSIAKIIFMLVFYARFRHTTPETLDDKEKSFAIQRIVSQYQDAFFLIIEDEGELKKITIDDGYPNLDLKELNNISFFSAYYQYMIDTWFDGNHDLWVKTIYHRSDGYETPLLLEPYKGSKKQTIDIDNLEFLTSQKIYTFYSSIIKNKIINSFFNPIQIRYKFSVVFALNEDGEYKSMYKLIDKFLGMGLLYGVTNQNVLKSISNEIDDLHKNKKLNEINKLYIVLKVLESDKSYFNKDIVRHFESNMQKLQLENRTTGDNKACILDLIKDEGIDYSLLIIEKGFPETAKIEKCLMFLDLLSDQTRVNHFKQYLDEQTDIHTIREFFEFLPPWVDINFYDEEKQYKSLSSGEKILFSFLVNLSYQISNIEKRYSFLNIFLDEVEFGLHPYWQKSFIKELLSTLESFKEIKFNVYLFSHSPFILSDIPSENVIFLDKDKVTGNCKVINGLKGKKQTFGSNIHTLLSDAFFMEDGLMGEFAKGKINDIINFCNGKELESMDNEIAQKHINLIGEPILKRQLQKMLDSKRLTKIDKIHLIEEQIKELQKQLLVHQHA